MKHGFGYAEGDVCNRYEFVGPYCKGVIQTHPSEGCSCHINPPCSSCTAPRNFCPVCEWEEKNDMPFNDHIVNVDPKTGVFKHYEWRKLDNSKIDWHSKEHTSSSMIKEGVYPAGTTQDEVRKLVDGTFGGRFEHFGKGHFKFIAYTD